MEGFLIFILIATITILSPGPGVLLTLTNSLKHGTLGALPSILGISFGTFIVAGISATGLGILLATSSLAFTIMKYVGACYLIYLGLRLWFSPPINLQPKQTPSSKKIKARFLEGVLIQLTNPKAVFFFLSVFPQFISLNNPNILHFFSLVVCYSALVIAIHILYAYLANSAKNCFASSRGGRIINKFSGGAFICFGAGLASVSK